MLTWKKRKTLIKNNTKQSTEDNSNTEKLLKEDQTNINKEK